MMVATAVVFLPVIWKVGVMTWRSFSEGIKDLFWSRSHPGEPEAEPRKLEEEEGEVSLEGRLGTTPQEDSQPEKVQEVPSGSPERISEGRMQTPTSPRLEGRPMTISEEWEEIEREEARIRREVWLGMPHVMGNHVQGEEEPRELLDLPFTVFCTKYGKVYNTN